MFVEHFDRLDGIAAAVHDQVGGIEVDAEILPVNVLQEFQQDLRWLLTCFKRERLPVQSSMIANPSHQITNSRVPRIAPVLRNEPNVARDTLDADCGGEMADVLGPLLAFGSRTFRDEPNSLLYGRDVGVA